MAAALKKSWFNIKTPILIIIILIDFILIVLYSLVSYNIEYREKKQEIDKKLFSGAIAITNILAEEFQEIYLDKSFINDDRETENRAKLSEISKQYGLSYVFSMIENGGRVYFTGCSSLSNQLINGSAPRYFESYNEATELNKKAFDSNRPLYEDITNQWGSFRTIYVPLETENGTRYIAGANISLDAINSSYRSSMLKNGLSAVLFLILVLPFFILYVLSIRKDKKELSKQLYTDILTLLPNRQKLLEEISLSRSPVLMLINIDNFKEINDFYGNDVGDFLLISLANRIKVLLSNSEYKIYKMQADEFAVFMDSNIAVSEIEIFLEYLWNGISEKPFYYGGNQILITVAIGAARADTEKQTVNNPKNAILSGQFPQSLKKWGNIPVHADMALKKAKKTQKHFIIYHESLAITKEYENNILWTRMLREALKDDRIIPYFQPIVNNKTQKIEKYECLIRMKDTEGNIIGPDKFLDVSKKSRFYHQITRLILEKSLEKFKDNDYEFSINLAILDILDDDTNRFIMKKLNEYKNIASRLVFEILESEGIENYKEVKEFIDEVKKYGSKFAIDDFGSGYSNFAHIMKLHVDYIKIDASIIENIDKDYYCQIIAKNITNVAKELGLKTISEYVRSKEVFDKVVELGMEYSQGFYFGRPGPELAENHKPKAKTKNIGKTGN